MKTEDLLNSQQDQDENTYADNIDLGDLQAECIYLIGREEEEQREDDLQMKGGESDRLLEEFSLEQENFNMGVHWFFRIFLVHMTKMTHIIRKNIINLKYKLEFRHIPQLTENEKVDKKCLEIDELLEDILKGNQVEGKDVLTIIKFIFKKDFIISNILTALTIMIRLLNSVIIFELILSYAKGGPYNAIKWVIALFIILVFESCLYSQSFNSSKQLSAKIRLSLVSFLYTRTAQLTKNQIQKANIGKLFNLISYDLNTLESMIYFLIMVSYVPLLLIVASCIIYWRIGYYGLIGIFIIAITLPIQVLITLGSQKFLKIKNKNSDQRIKFVNQSIEGVRSLKLYGWEEIFQNLINEERKKELNSISGMQYYRSTDRAFSISLSLIAGFISILLMYYNDSQNLNAAVIFSTLDLFYGLKNNLFLAGIGISFSFELGLMLNRLAEYLRLKNVSMIQVKMNPEFDSEKYEKSHSILEEQWCLRIERKVKIQNPKTKIDDKNDELSPEELDLLSKQDSNQRYIIGKSNESTPENLENQFEFLNLSTLWDIKNPNFGLKEITVNIKKGFHYGLVGKIGSGKSTFLQAILGEVPYCLGELKKIGTLSYVEQEPYIFAGNIRDNILFGKQYDPIFYDEVISACCLKDDFDQLIDGDETEVGEKGVNLSGGQRSRISLARAVYSQNDTYLLDDPLSSIDPKVAEQLSENLFSGILKGKTVILVTHQILFTQLFDEIIILQDGIIYNKGPYSELYPILMEMNCLNNFKPNPGSQFNEIGQNENPQQLSRFNTNSQSGESNFTKILRGKLIEPENLENTKVTIQTYKKYFSYIGSWSLVCGNIFLFILNEFFFTGFYFYLGSFDGHEDKEKLFIKSGSLLVGYILTCLSKYYFTIWLIQEANQNMHNDMFSSISRAQVQYFDKTPSGRILNRFSTDIGSVDMMLPYIVFVFLENFFQVLIVTITVSIFNPWISITFIILMILSSYYLKLNHQILIESKSLDQISKSPIYTLFVMTIQGIIHLRIYKQLDYFFKEMCLKANNSIRSNFLFWNINQAFGFNIQMFTIIISFISIIIFLFSALSPNYLGQTITFIVILINSSYQLVKQIPILEIQMLSVERMQQICRLQLEGPLFLQNDEFITEEWRKSSDSVQFQNKNRKKELKWNIRGEIEFKEVFLKYREDLDFALSSTSFRISQGEHVGCIGRTGAGKSSILAALFRMNEISRGSIFIDNVNISSVGLHTLRKAISIIPQVPFIFPGSIRQNIDPLFEYSDDEIYDVLELIQLREMIKSFPKGIFEEVIYGNFSSGQKQLICFARVILKKSNILVLDEATSNIDNFTNQLVQSIVKRIFQNSTIFTITHRLNTIADYDKIIVMDEGKVVEFDSPYLLLVEQIGDSYITSKSIFAQMVLATGENNSSIIFQISQEKYYLNKMNLL